VGWRGSKVAARHHAVVALIDAYLKTAHAASHVEPYALGDHYDRRPDIDATLGPRRVLVDVTVRDPAFTPQSAGNPDFCEKSVTAQKRLKNQEMTRECRASFVPFYLDIFGSWGKDAMRFAKGVRDAHWPWLRLAVITRW